MTEEQNIAKEMADHDKHYWCLVRNLQRRKKNAGDLADLIGEGSTVAEAIWNKYAAMESPSPAPEVMGTPSDLVAEAFVPVYNAIDILQEKLLYLVSPEATPNALNDALLLLRRVCVRVAHKKDLNDVAKQIQEWLGRNDHNSIVRMAGVQDEACPDCEGIHSPKVNVSFVQPATGKGESTFWCPQCLSIQLIFDWNDGSMLCNECKFHGNVNKFLFTVPPEKK